MTVDNVPNRVQENGNDINVDFDFSFKIFASTDIEVYVVDNTTEVAVLQTIITDYTVAFDSEGQTGTVTYLVAVPTGSSSLIISKFPLSQETDIPTASNFPEIAIENEFDKSRLIDQQIQEQINRSVLLPVQSNLTGLEIPVSVANANKVIAVNSAGDNLEARTTTEVVQVDKITTRGDLVKGDSVGVSERLALGANGYVLTSDGVDPSWQAIPDILATTSTKGKSLLSNPITISNGTDTDHDIDFTAGNFMFSDGSGQAVASALTKQIDATWAAGDAAGGLADALTVAIDTTYHCFALSNASGSSVDFGFDTSLTATNLLADVAVSAAGLTKYSRQFSIITNASANILGFEMTRLSNSSVKVILDTAITVFSGLTPPLSTDLILSTPFGLQVGALLSGPLGHTSSSCVYRIQSKVEGSALYTSAIGNVALSRAAITPPYPIRTNNSSTIAHGYDITLGPASIALDLHGWIDYQL